MKVNVAVCGIFHYRKFIGFYSRYRTLNTFYFSHRLTTTQKSLGVEYGRLKNLWLKEYLIRAGCACLPQARDNGQLDAALHRLWEQQVLRSWDSCDLFHVLLHGTAAQALARAKRENAVTVGEPVMTHPEVLQQILEEEHEHLQIPAPPPIWPSFRRLIEEVELCDYLVVGSRVIRDSFIAKGISPKRTHVLSLASDTRHFFPLSHEERERLTDGKFRVICVAQITPRKGIHYLLDAWKRLDLPKSKAELLLIGRISSAMKPVLARYAGLFSHLDSVPHEQLRQHYGRSSVFVLPSVEDGFGMVTTEAMACGLPAVVSEAAGSADIIEDGVNGFVVPARSSDLIEAKLRLLYDDRDLHAAMANRAVAACQANLQWSDYAYKLATLHALWCGRKAPSPQNKSYD